MKIFIALMLISLSTVAQANMELRCVVKSNTEWAPQVRKQLADPNFKNNNYYFVLKFDSASGNANLISTQMVIPKSLQRNWNRVSFINFDSGFTIDNNQYGYSTVSYSNDDSGFDVGLVVEVNHQTTVRNALRPESKFTYIATSIDLTVNGNKMISSFATCYRSI